MVPRVATWCVLALLGLSGHALAQTNPAKESGIGVLSPATSSSMATRLEAFRQELAAHGYQDGKNLRIEYRWGDGKDERLSALAGELARLDVSILVVHGVQAAIAARGIGRSMPIVCLLCGDLVGTGLVDSLSRPGGNITGMTSINPATSGKRLELLGEVVRGLKKVAILWNPRNPVAIQEVKETEAAARKFRVNVQSLAVSDAGGFQEAFNAMTKEGTQALIVLSDATYMGRRREIAALALSHKIPSIAWTDELATSGVLMSYGADPVAMSRRAATFVIRILNGASPAELPVEQPTKFKLLVNAKTAKALGVSVPRTLLTRADQILE